MALSGGKPLASSLYPSTEYQGVIRKLLEPNAWQCSYALTLVVTWPDREQVAKIRTEKLVAG